MEFQEVRTHTVGSHYITTFHPYAHTPTTLYRLHEPSGRMVAACSSESVMTQLRDQINDQNGV
jgi:hypothetical protein